MTGTIVGSILTLGSGDAVGAVTLAGMAGIAFTTYQWRRTAGKMTRKKKRR
jgi:hypothetical protein